MAALVGWQTGVLLILRVYQQRGHPRAETVRKLFHLNGGLVALALPWVFDDVWPVAVLALLSVLLLIALEKIPLIQSSLGTVLTGVGRDTLGEFWFVMGVLLLFVMARHHFILYAVPILVLAISDAVAALVGAVYGQHPFSVFHGTKTAEGSIAFFFTAFLCVHLPVLLGTNTGRLESVMTGVSLAFLLMLTEVVAWRGLDNLLLPLLVFVLLRTFINASLVDLGLQLAALMTLGGIVLFWRRRTTLAGDALFGSILAGYGCWILGGVLWLLPPALLFTTYTTLSETTERDANRPFHIPVVVAVFGSGSLWLLGAWLWNLPEFYYPYTASYAANLAMIARARQRLFEATDPVRTTLMSSVKGTVVLVPSLLLADGLTTRALVNCAAGIACILLATTLFHKTTPAVDLYAVEPSRWARQSIIAFLASFVALAPHYSSLAARLQGLMR